MENSTCPCGYHPTMKKQLLFFLFTSLSLITIAQHQAYLDIGNVRALVNSNGLLFHDTATNRAGFEVPKGDGIHSIFQSGFILSSFSQRNAMPHFTLAHNMYSYDSDFVIGPVDIINQTPDNAAQFQRLWKINKTDIDNHIANWNTSNYSAAQIILDWPGNGTFNTAKILAPFNDLDGDSIYEPLDGEYPIIKGDQAIFLMANNFSSTIDSVNQIKPRIDSNNRIIGYDTLPAASTIGKTQVEIHLLIYAYLNRPEEISNTVFVKTKLFNRANDSQGDMNDFRFSVFSDFDLGNSNDDYIGTDTNRNLFYGYNGDSFDESPRGYGNNLAAQGVKFLNHSISSSMMRFPDNITTWYEYPQNIYGYQQSLWKNGSPLYFGGNGYALVGNCTDTSQPVQFIFSGDPTLTSDPNQWTELNPCFGDTSETQIAGDRQMIGTPNIPLQFNHNSSIELDYAYVFAQDTGGVVASVAALQVAADSVQAFYDRNRFVGINENTTSASLEFHIYPNPASEEVFIETDQQLFNVELFNLEGQMMSQFANTKRLDVSHLSNGIYFIRISSENNVGVRRLVIHK